MELGNRVFVDGKSPAMICYIGRVDEHRIVNLARRRTTASVTFEPNTRRRTLSFAKSGLNARINHLQNWAELWQQLHVHFLHVDILYVSNSRMQCNTFVSRCRETFR